MAKPIRHWMKIDTRMVESSKKEQTRLITFDDAPRLADLMDKSFKDTIDYEGETPEQCLNDMKDTLTGKYGPFLDFASFCAVDEKQTISASILTLYKGKPLLAYSMTDPAFQGKGIGRNLIEQSITALAKQGFASLYLVVTSGNAPAENLYSRIGFTRIGEATPGSPPPFDYRIETVVAATHLTEIKTFYQLCSYPGPVGERDDMVLAWSDNRIVGVVRLVNEHGVFILRGMNIHPDMQRQGIGSNMLAEFAKLIAAKKAETVYCLCGAHLESYYGALHFEKVVALESVPAFLIERMNGYQAKLGSQIVMRRSHKG